MAQHENDQDANWFLRPEIETVEERLPSGAVARALTDGAQAAWVVLDPDGRAAVESQPWTGTVEEALAEAAQVAVMLAVRRGWIRER